MRLRRRSANLLVESPSAASGDIAFNLIVFFLVCASVQPDSGRMQDLPRSESKQEQKQEAKNIEVALSRTSQSVNGITTSDARFQVELAAKLRAKSDPADRIVVVKSAKDTPFDRWVLVTGWINAAGGIVTLQLEEEQVIAQ